MQYGKVPMASIVRWMQRWRRLSARLVRIRTALSATKENFWQNDAVSSWTMRILVR